MHGTTKERAIGEPVKDKARASSCVTEERGKHVGGEIHGIESPGGTNHAVSKNELHKDGTNDGAALDLGGIPREEPGQTDKNDKSQETDHIAPIAHRGSNHDCHDKDQETADSKTILEGKERSVKNFGTKSTMLTATATP